MLKAQNFEKVVINTASGKKVRNFVWSSLSTSIDYYGVLHHLQKLRKSTTQGLINLRIKRYFFLAEYLSKSAKALKPRMQFQHFYAGFLPEEAGSKTIIKPEGEKWIVIPGQVEYKRRDYLALLRSLEGQKQSNLRFILLGKSKHDYGDGVDLEARIKAQALQGQFKLWDDYVPADEFHQYLAQADYVLPLIHANHPSGSLYQQQISGAWNMATALKIPLLLEEGSPGCLDFADAALFYPPHGLNQIWKEKEPRPRGFYQHKKWSFEQQMQAYCQFLLD